MHVAEKQLRSFILDSGLVSRANLEAAEKEAREQQASVGAVLVKKGTLSEDDLRRIAVSGGEEALKAPVAGAGPDAGRRRREGGEDAAAVGDGHQLIGLHHRGVTFVDQFAHLAAYPSQAQQGHRRDHGQQNKD